MPPERGDFRVQGSGFRVQGAGFRVQGARLSIGEGLVLWILPERRD